MTCWCRGADRCSSWITWRWGGWCRRWWPKFVGGAAAACEAVGAALLGGETAEMPGVYARGELDIVGTLVGMVDRPALVSGERLTAGDAVIALPSSGLHTNGYSLARRVLEGLDWEQPRPELGGTLLDALLTPHRVPFGLRGAAGGRPGRARHGPHHRRRTDRQPAASAATGPGPALNLGSWTLPPLFALIVERGRCRSTRLSCAQHGRGLPVHGACRPA